ncbi:hypothetical protein [Actinosynnema sp.]|uniref:hypothetical protein n=1 Tax=Actinosynnema sp. TaxID=1872144 RepID=UPI003F86161D
MARDPALVDVTPASPRTGPVRGPGTERVVTTLGRPVAVVTLTVTVVLSALSAATVLHDTTSEWFRALSVGGEANVPSWWSATLLLACSVVCVLVAVLHAGGWRPGRGMFLLVAAGFAALSLDETASLHERLGYVAYWARDAFGVPIPTYAWVGPGLVVALVVGFFFARWLLQLPRDVVRLVGAGAVLVVVGAFGLEAAAGLAWQSGSLGMMYALTALEELFETVGMVLALLGLLRLLRVVTVPTGAGLRRTLALLDGLAP